MSVHIHNIIDSTSIMCIFQWFIFTNLLQYCIDVVVEINSIQCFYAQTIMGHEGIDKLVVSHIRSLVRCFARPQSVATKDARQSAIPYTMSLKHTPVGF